METGICELEYNGTTSQIPHGIAEVLNLNFVQVAENLKGTHSTNTHPNQSPQSIIDTIPIPTNSFCSYEIEVSEVSNEIAS